MPAGRLRATRRRRRGPLALADSLRGGRPLQISAQLASHLLALQCMNFTLDEITQQQDRLRQEIMERQCLLAAFDVMHGYMSKDHSPGRLELGSLVSALSPALPVAALPGESAVAPAVLPMPVIEPPYVHPELKAIGDRFGSNVQIVRWAIARMTEDYSLMDIRALLRREGRPLR